MRLPLITSLPVVRRLVFLFLLCLSVRTAVCQSPPSGEATSATELIATESKDTLITSGEAILLKMRQGGITIIFLLVVSVIAVATTLERIVHLRISRIAPRQTADLMEQLCREGRIDELGSTAAAAGNSTLGRVVTVLVRHRGASSTDLATLAGDMASREMKLHLLRAYPLMICATLSPLLGLFGTVAGMIGAFDKVAAAGSLGDASMLGGDISKALITTAAGLVVAIPALGLYHFFRSRTTLMAILLEERISEIITTLRGNKEAIAGSDGGGGR